jgi:hypothetical protein
MKKLTNKSIPPVDPLRIYQLAHRVSYRMFFGEFNPELLVCHKCDNPSCVNPNHLFLGTHQDNVNDKIIKGRGFGWEGPKGEQQGGSKLKTNQVLYIREVWAKANGTIKQYELAKDLQVSQQLISMIVRRKCWTHV